MSKSIISSKSICPLALAFSVTALAALSGGCAADTGDDVEEDEAVGESSSELFGSGDSAPACVMKTKDEKSGALASAKQVVTVKNTCKKNVKVTLDLQFTADPECVTIAPGGTSTWTFRSFKTVRKVKTCK